MATYLMDNDILIERQEGDTADLEIEINEVLDISTLNPYLQVKTLRGVTIITKEATDFIKDGQTLTCSLPIEDTKNRAGAYRWEMKLYNGSTLITSCGGDFIIKSVLIKDMEL